MVEFNISNTDSVKFPRITKRFQNVIRNLLHYGIVLQYRHIGEQLIPSSDNDIFTLTDPSPIGVGSMGVVLRGKYQNKNIVINYNVVLYRKSIIATDNWTDFFINY